MDRTDDPAGGGRERGLAVRFHQRAQAQVEDLDLALLAQEEVGRLDVAVDDPALMGMGEAQGGLGHVIDHLGGRERAPVTRSRGRGSDRLRTP